MACFDRRVETKPGTGGGLKYEMDDVSRWEEGYKGLKINLEKCPRKNVELKSCNGLSRLKVRMDVGGFGNVGYVKWVARTWRERRKVLVGAAKEALANKGKAVFFQSVAVADLLCFVERVLKLMQLGKRDQTKQSQPVQREIDKKCCVRAMCLDDVILSEKRKK